MIRPFAPFLVTISCLAVLSGRFLSATSSVDLALVLAMDASGSVDEREFNLQMAGIAAGFRDPAVRTAITSGPERRVAVSLLVWLSIMQPVFGRTRLRRVHHARKALTAATKTPEEQQAFPGSIR